MTATETRPGLNSKERAYLAQLKRLRDLKAARLKDYKGRSMSYTQAEVGALNFAIALIERCADEGIVHDFIRF